MTGTTHSIDIAERNTARQIPRYDRRSTQATRRQPAAPVKKRTSMAARFLRKLQIPLITIAAIIIGELAQSLVFGEIAIALYAIIALVYHISSRTTFLFSLITLVTVVVLYCVSADSPLAPNFATYTFGLIIIGILSMGREASEASHV